MRGASRLGGHCLAKANATDETSETEKERRGGRRLACSRAKQEKPIRVGVVPLRSSPSIPLDTRGAFVNVTLDVGWNLRKTLALLGKGLLRFLDDVYVIIPV